MPKFSCKIERVTYVNIIADTEDDVRLYLEAHSINDLINQVKDPDVYDTKEIIEEVPMEQGNEISIDIRRRR